MTPVYAEAPNSVSALMTMKYALIWVILLSVFNYEYELCNKAHLKCNGIQRMEYKKCPSATWGPCSPHVGKKTDSPDFNPL